MSDFTPGVERAKAAGYKIDVKPYVGTGEQQVRQSLELIAKKIRDGRLDPDVRGWAGDTLIAAGRPKTSYGKIQALLDAFRQATVYVADPVGAEYIATAAATACLRPGLCVRARDCDDGTVFMGSAILSIGIPVKVLKQGFGPGRQEHVLVEALSDDGSWIPVDPSTSLPAGEKVRAVQEVRLDPMDQVGSSGTSGPEIVSLGGVPSGVGAPAPAREVRKVSGRWTERRYGRWYAHVTGVGWVDVGAGDACCAACAEGKPCAGETPLGHAGRSAQDPEPGQGTGSDRDEEGCSACEAYAKKLRGTGKLARYGLSGPLRGPLGAILRWPGLGALQPGSSSDTPPAAAPTSSAPPPGSNGIGLGQVILLTVGTIVVGGVGYGLVKRSMEQRA